MNIVIFLIVCGSLVLLFMQRQGKLPFARSKAKLSPSQRNVFNLEIGDIVQYDGVDWFVEGKLIYNTDSYNWFEYLLRDNDDILWLSVEEDDIVEVSVLKEVDIPEINSSPPKAIAYQDIEYRLADSGTATALRLGNTLNRQAQKFQYYDYKSSSFHRMSVEIWNGQPEITVGRKINPRMLNFLPGDGQKVYG